MSASNTNLEKQKRRHAGPLIGISLALLVASGLFVAYLMYNADAEEAAPAPPAEQMEERSVMPEPGGAATPMDNPEGAPNVVAPAQQPT